MSELTEGTERAGQDQHGGHGGTENTEKTTTAPSTLVLVGADDGDLRGNAAMDDTKVQIKAAHEHKPF